MSLKTLSVIVVSSDLHSDNKKNFEILSYVLNELRTLKYQVKKITLLPEDEQDIARELQEQSKFNDIVIVVGNISNVIIYRALARATSQEIQHETCFLPASARTFTDNGLNCISVVCLQRIFILSDENIKVLSSNAVNGHLKHYRLEPTYAKSLKIKNSPENLDFLKNLTPAIYTFTKHDDFTSVQLSSASFDEIVESERLILQKGIIVVESIEKNPLEDLIYSSKDKHVQEALEVIEKCFNDYSPERVFLSFNGGKDCTVLLHLVLTVLRRKFPKFREKVLCLYVRNENAFEEQDKFINQCGIYYGLEIITVCKNIKEALRDVLDDKPNMAATFMGSRRTDPFCNHLNIFQMTDADWPRIMRVSPLLDWHYSDIWDYLLYYKVPYCKLYDMGYTSLGNSLNTIRNPCLIYRDVDGKEAYLPAYKMMNEAKERSGRNVKKA